ncbi:MAG: ATP-NAD kinase family protein [Candidatus Thermoplasmatota archaeon]
MKKIGFIINPIAGMGGKVGLKGTDGKLEEAIKRGAKPIAEGRAIEFLSNIKKDYEFITCSSEMGENALLKSGKKFKIVYETREKTTADDTKKSAKIISKNSDIIVFVGGDGTARDIFEAVGASIPLLGVPSGVKMFSGVFALTPKDASEIVDEIDELGYEEREIFDIDEDAIKEDKMIKRIVGYAIVPSHKKIQSGKEIYYGDGKEEIASWIIEEMEEDVLYIVGGGSTTWEIKKRIGNGSFLGIDLIKNRSVVFRDASENDIKRFLEEKTKIIVSPMGKQGFIFGRGNQPISAEIIKKLGKENIIVISTKEKLNEIDFLKVDTGSEEVNEMLRGFIPVYTGYKEKKIMEVI